MPRGPCSGRCDAAITGSPARHPSPAVTAAPDLTVLRVLAATLDDVQQMRVMTGNRIGAAERTFGDALPHLHEVHEPLLDAERRAEMMLRRVWRRHPLAPWARSVPGCGEKLIARLPGIVHGVVVQMTTAASRSAGGTSDGAWRTGNVTHTWSET